MAITGTDNADSLPGTDLSEVINGLGGNDTIIGYGGNDTLNGGSGDDIFRIGGTNPGTDYFNGGDGADRIQLSSDLVVSQLLLNSTYLTSTEMLDFSYYDISGTGGNDVFDISGITLTNSYGMIYMLDGADRFTGYIGNDLVDGGAGNDTLIGGAGNDTLVGGNGNDNLMGGTGDDVFRIGGSDFGFDIYNGGDGADRILLTSDVTVSRLTLMAGNVLSTELLDFSYYDIEGTGGDDIFNISGIASTNSYGTIYMYDGNDAFTGYAGSDYVDGGSGNDTLNGAAGDDTLTGGTGNDNLIGGTGNDTFRIGGSDFGLDIYNGGAGADRILLTSDVTVSRLQLTSGNVIGTETLDFSYYDIEGTGGNDIFNISGITNTNSYGRIYMYDGNDGFTGYAGNDYVDGGAGNDTLNGGAGNDELIGGTGDDSLFGGTGNDTFLIGGNNFGNDIYNGGLGADTIRLTSDIAVSRFTLTAANVIGTEILDMSYYDISGTGGNDIFNISAIRQVSSYSRIDLLDGNDIFTGHIGNDYVDGGAGNDTLIGGAGNDTLLGGTGRDMVSYAAAAGGVTVNLALTEAQTLGGGQGTDRLESIESVIGSNFADRITGNAAANNLIGGAGNDVLAGGMGNDTLNGGTGIDTASYAGSAGSVTVNLTLTGPQTTGGGQGVDTLIQIENLIGSKLADRLTGNAGANNIDGGFGHDVLNGGAGNDTLLGGLGNDTVIGGAGNDVIWGHAGNDVLTGGLGVDQFHFLAANNADRITDWQNGIDRIVIHGGAAYDEFRDLNISTVNGNAVISFGGTSITLVGASAGMVDASDFTFV
ncbi:beta strand repeat-containing protein [Paracoccus laeviglucosivorans]|uniref:Hemolysin-type calcium-binding repeat-containing protein n=1 Tax=Paracoccus laeviglucosivorans TaxID=1197861 RepID=A0A521D2K8_9RHOB|nr:calcium-binding protein [Paracoccus laeviglucosivorans]SMO65928.1 Hemolysin-type calcium-binding repeat-containing protein [Paracoccus laeviglucosivorans]